MAFLLTLVYSPLVGPATWEPAATELRRRGWEVAVPDLRHTLADGPPYASGQVSAVADCVNGRPTVLVGHSGAGPLLGPVAEALREVAGCVFVDAGLPTPGETSLQNMPAALAGQLRSWAVNGWLPPWASWWGDEAWRELVPDDGLRALVVDDCPALPLAMFEEPLPPAPRWLETPSAYLQLSEAYQDPAGRARRLGWPVVELSGHHLSLVTEPGAVVRSLLHLVATLLG